MLKISIIFFIAVCLLGGSCESQGLQSANGVRNGVRRSGIASRTPRSHKSLENGCNVAPTTRIYRVLNRICEDCFQLYRDAEVYQFCRSDCFGSNYFSTCMDALLMETTMRDEVNSLAATINRFA